MDRIRLAVVGVGNRGCGFVGGLFGMFYNEGLVTVTAVCDLYQDRVDYNAGLVENITGVRPFTTTDYRELLNRDDIDAVTINTAWEAHIEVATAFMKAGKYAAMEVGGAYSVDDCWKLVRTYEETGTHCMLLENCNYGIRELLVLNMVHQGLFGSVVHCSGRYGHDLRGEVLGGNENRHYRLRNYLSRNCENYPTHELGPIAKVLDINNGNRMVSLVAMASPARGMHEYAVAQRGTDDELAKAEFHQGDVVTTLIKCANGETIELTLDTTLPRFYSRDFTVRGTKFAYFGNDDIMFEDGVHNKYDSDASPIRDNAWDYNDKYCHPLWEGRRPNSVHDGIDELVYRAFFDAVKNNARPPIDEYDAAAYMVIAPLSEMSIQNGSSAVSIPDFTNGKWIKRTDIVDSKYCLDRIKNK